MSVNLEAAKQTRFHIKKERRQLLLRRFFSNKPVVIGTAILAVACLIAVLAPFLTSHGPLDIDPKNRLHPPSAEHLFGTDNFGRDVFSRVVYGTRVSVTVGFSVALIASFIGMVTGLLSAYYSLLDHIFMRICDGLFAFPSILLAIAIMVTMGPSTTNVIIALSIVYMPSVARIVRSAALVVREQNYIEALHAQGASSWRIIWMHMAPNTTSPLIIQATYIFAVSILTEASLSFLGAGIPAPNPSLGNILYDGKAVIFVAWWMTVFPGIFIMAMIFALNLFGDGLRDLLDPHANRSNK
jgi:peptide/nickel transport system permease protein